MVPWAIVQHPSGDVLVQSEAVLAILHGLARKADDIRADVVASSL